ncbi:MAG: hypothetical protein QOD74_1467 [Variibacter sp.]|nr:hypothetical protein [Variibacter sp.]
MPAKTKDRNNPEWTEDDFARGRKFAGEKLAVAVQELMRERGRPRKDEPKQSIKLRIDADVLRSYRATGSGWQSRINSDLRKARKLKVS